METIRTTYDRQLTEQLQTLLELRSPVDAIDEMYHHRAGQALVGRSAEDAWFGALQAALEQDQPTTELAGMGLEETWYLRLTPKHLTHEYPLVFFYGTLTRQRGLGILDESGRGPLWFANLKTLTIEEVVHHLDPQYRRTVLQFVKNVLLVAC